MTILFSSQIDAHYESVVGSLFGNFGETLGIPGFPFNGSAGETTSDVLSLKDKMNSVLNKLLGNTEQNFDPNYVESGKQVVIGSGIEGGKVPAIEMANVRQVYSQTPQASVLIKKRSFSSLQDLNNPVYMDPAEKWLMRATKRLVARKCKIMSDYERLTKIEKLTEAGMQPNVILSALLSDVVETFGGDLSSAEEFRKTAYYRQPVRTTTYFVSPEFPIIEELGAGSGVFEITSVSNINTQLSIAADNDSFSINLEDPYRILFVTEEDIDAAIKESAFSGIINQLDVIANESLNTAQRLDNTLSQQRRSRGKSEISFNIGLNYGVSAIIDAIGFEINENNIDSIPEEQSLNGTEQTIFTSVLASLRVYQESFSKNILSGVNSLDIGFNKQMQYARDKMRMFHLGKSIIQPMDAIHIFIDGGTRRDGEGADVENDLNIFSFDGAINFAANTLGSDNVIDEDLLINEWNRAGQFPDFDTFKKMRILSLSTENGVQVFSGLVKKVEDKFNAESGTYVLSINGVSNMEWLEISRYNKEPSLDQTQGIIYDPLTPFEIEVDKANCLPTGKVKLSDANTALLSTGSHYFNTGPAKGKKCSTIDDMNQDIAVIGRNLINLYQHVPGLVYKWKEGIMTATYNTYTSNPLDSSLTTLNQLRRDVGYFASNTPFDNMDAANIISLLITGVPYNPATFIRSALNSGSYNLDATLNNGKDYFRSFLNIQGSMNKVQGNFVPFKSITVDAFDLARSIYFQRRIFDTSAELTQLRNQQAQLEDQIKNLSDIAKDPSLKDGLGTKLSSLGNKITTLSTSLSSLSQEQKESGKNLISIAGGNDISFDLKSITNNEEYRLFGEQLNHATLRRREDVIQNKDKNYFIVSDEYDKDYDIQAMVIELRKRLPEMWKTTWLPVRELCKTVAEILNFELFASTQGHIVFRPPQYNKTPRSVMEQMLSLSSNAGIKLFPDFLTSLFQSRQDSLYSQIKISEWEIRKDAALLGASTDAQIIQLIQGEKGAVFHFITDSTKVKTAAKSEQAINPQEKVALQKKVAAANSLTQLTYSEGLFSANAQLNLQGDLSYQTNIGAEQCYVQAIETLASLTGQEIRTYPVYDNAKIGAARNGVSTPVTDISNIINNISSTISERAQYLRALERVLDQSIEIASVNQSGEVSLGKNLFNMDNLSSDIYNRLIEDDTKDYLGHMSGSRFVIKDESIIDCSFTETPPDMTVCTVTGGMPILGEKGNLSGMPIITAFGVDFDLWRQYGFKAEKPFDKPFFSNADYQCAPYAVMLLSRQRKNIVTGTITVMGNEFYQLGDVVYVAHRQMLYYVTEVSHAFTYSGTGDFRTTLKLNYGHPPGQYIPTPLDLIGKMQTTTGNAQSAYRIRREQPRLDATIATIYFESDSDMFAGKFAKRNYEQLVNALTLTQTEINRLDYKNSPRIYCLSFFGDSASKLTAVKNWLSNPVSPDAARNGLGVNGLGGNLTNVSSIKTNSNISSFKIDPKLIKTQAIKQDNPTEADLALLSEGYVASQENFALDPESQGNVVEIRLRQPPIGGWLDE